MAFDVWSVVQPAALDVIHAHVMSSTDVEVGGFMIGTHGGEREPPHCVAAIEARAAVGDLTRLTFTHEAWENVHRAIEESHPECSIVGWYHSHPGHGIFLSDHDRFIHHNFFPAPWQIALVVDPVQRTEGLFVWTGGELKLADERRVGGAGTSPATNAPSTAFTSGGRATPDIKRERLVVQPDAPATLIAESELQPAPPVHEPPAATDRTPRAAIVPDAPASPSPPPEPAPEPRPIAASEARGDSRHGRRPEPASARPSAGYPFAGHILPLAAGLVAGLVVSFAIF